MGSAHQKDVDAILRDDALLDFRFPWLSTVGLEAEIAAEQWTANDGFQRD
jgi:hypothetical protein